MCRNTKGHVFLYHFLGSEMKEKVLPKGMLLSHIEVTIFFSVKFVCLFVFFHRRGRTESFYEQI